MRSFAAIISESVTFTGCFIYSVVYRLSILLINELLLILLSWVLFMSIVFVKKGGI